VHCMNATFFLEKINWDSEKGKRAPPTRTHLILGYIVFICLTSRFMRLICVGCQVRGGPKERNARG
jgi:hypothetical protein